MKTSEEERTSVVRILKNTNTEGPAIEKQKQLVRALPFGQLRTMHLGRKLEISISSLSLLLLAEPVARSANSPPLQSSDWMKHRVIARIDELRPLIPTPAGDLPFESFLPPNQHVERRGRGKGKCNDKHVTN